MGNLRHAGIQDWSGVGGVAKLHGDVNRFNFLVRDGDGNGDDAGRIWVVDFEHSEVVGEVTDGVKAVMEAEMEKLAVKLADESGAGGGFWRIEKMLSAVSMGERRFCEDAVFYLTTASSLSSSSYQVHSYPSLSKDTYHTNYSPPISHPQTPSLEAK